MTGLRTIVIGFGQIAHGLAMDEKMAEHFEYATHAQVLRDHPAFDWRGVVELAEGPRVRAARDWRVPHVSDDLSAVASAVLPEVAIITAPPGRRADMLEALPGLKAVLIEKPLDAPGGADGARFLETCARRGVEVLVNYWRRGDETMQALAGGDLTGKIGGVQALTGLYGDGLFNNGGHMIDLIRMLTGEITAVRALAPLKRLKNAPIPGDPNIPVALDLAGGAIATLQPLDFSVYREVGLDIWGTTGRLAILQEGLSARHFSLTDNRGLMDEREIASDKPAPLPATAGRALYRLYDNLAAIARGQKSAISSGTSAARNDAILQAAVTSAESDGARIAL